MNIFKKEQFDKIVATQMSELETKEETLISLLENDEQKDAFRAIFDQIGCMYLTLSKTLVDSVYQEYKEA